MLPALIIFEYISYEIQEYEYINKCFHSYNGTHLGMENHIHNIMNDFDIEIVPKTKVDVASMTKGIYIMKVGELSHKWVKYD